MLFEHKSDDFRQIKSRTFYLRYLGKGGRPPENTRGKVTKQTHQPDFDEDLINNLITP